MASLFLCYAHLTRQPISHLTLSTAELDLSVFSALLHPWLGLFPAQKKRTNNSSNKCRLHEKWRPVEICGPREAFEVFWISPYSRLLAAGIRRCDRNSVADRKQ